MPATPAPGRAPSSNGPCSTIAHGLREPAREFQREFQRRPTSLRFAVSHLTPHAKELPMSRIIVERNFETPQSDADMAQVADRERPCLGLYSVQWKRSL